MPTIDPPPPHEGPLDLLSQLTALFERGARAHRDSGAFVEAAEVGRRLTTAALEADVDREVFAAVASVTHALEDLGASGRSIGILPADRIDEVQRGLRKLGPVLVDALGVEQPTADEQELIDAVQAAELRAVTQCVARIRRLAVHTAVLGGLPSDTARLLLLGDYLLDESKAGRLATIADKARFECLATKMVTPEDERADESGR